MCNTIINSDNRFLENFKLEYCVVLKRQKRFNVSKSKRTKKQNN
jgi:hypothetical protein